MTTGCSHPSYEADAADWGTYTFDIYAYGYDDPSDTAPTDWFYLKWPYCLGDGGHNVWMTTEGDGSESLRYSYTLSDYAAANNYPNEQPPVSVSIIPMDIGLNELRNIQRGHTDWRQLWGR